MNKNLSVVNRVYGASNIVFGLETSTGTEQFVANTNKPVSRRLSNIIASDSQNTIINQNTINVSPESLIYINTNVNLTGIVTSADTTIFNSGWLIAPNGLPTTSIDNFTFFCNGQFIEKTAVTSFTQLNGVSTLVVNNAALGFILSSIDEVVAIGKFNI